jgi:hypothetical protein|tara:strand:- start:659 stop:850 length:192 start_codon:yes stop_codon:yes gene_type:complete
MRRKIEVIDKINSIQLEVERLHERTPEDTGDNRFDLILRITKGLKTMLDDLENIVELESDGIE